ncbi:[NiFe]-hydrogenase assembly chaperone HybE [Vibrio sonorensis]|uniref:[NiFe]-hydrogenase assembly chaperone HybE n=1 Tax=Vibrio sonorensis TaxID=1004316 RepID=UPI0008DAA084|nr:[NiFe]-hydrogenase assembly chaperone HybE [Vibrio sonorensis]
MPNTFIHNPAAIVERAFHSVWQQQMVELPFCNPNISVVAHGFEIFEEDWLGVLLTPWTLSLLLLPGPNRQWRTMQVGQKVTLTLPSGIYTFVAGEMDTLGTYLSCSLLSPVGNLSSMEQGKQLTRDIRHLVTAINVSDHTLENPSRRRLLNGQHNNPVVS